MTCGSSRSRGWKVLLALALLSPVVQGADGIEPAAWRKTLERIAPSVVSIQVDGTRAFDTEWNESSQASGLSSTPSGA
jgi:hypothetical protein